MNARYRCGAITAALLACGVITVAPARVQAQAPTMLPEGGGMITVVGCFVRSDHHQHGQSSRRYMLANPSIGPADTAPEATCSGDGGQAVDLKDTGEHHLGKEVLGRWIEITGRLER